MQMGRSHFTASTVKKRTGRPGVKTVAGTLGPVVLSVQPLRDDDDRPGVTTNFEYGSWL